jgi:cytochrome b pre-mRNA-processing protein 3
MLQRLLGRLVATPRGPDTAGALYAEIAAQARQPAFFRVFGFPDTVLGRLDVLHLNLFLVVHRLARAGSETAREFSQEIFDRHADALEVALRQIGIGDLSVTKRKKKMLRQFYGIVAEFDPVIDADALPELTAAAGRRFYADNPVAAARVAAYALAATRSLAALPLEELLAGRVGFPDPEAFA